MRLAKIYAATFIVVVPLAILALFWITGGLLSSPAPAPVGSCPLDLQCENITFPSSSGSEIKGWLIKGMDGKGAVVLMHGLRANRLALIDRMRFLRKAGFSILAFDFQGSGESEGKQLTFGYLEARDANASLKFAKNRFQNERIGVVGISMGGAAFLLQDSPESADGLLLEMVYPTIQRAIENRMNSWFFPGAEALSPFMTKQLPLRIGVSVDQLRPLDKIPSVKCPVFIIAGEKDTRTTLEESKALFEAANSPKEMWVVPDAEHGDLLKVLPLEYEKKTVDFFSKYLSK